MKKQTLVVFPLLFLAALIGMALVFYATGSGPGVGGDATIYLTAARNFASGHGLGWTEADGSFRILPYTPPFYPLALSGLALFVKDLVSGARWFNILLFGATVFLSGWFFYRFTGRAWLAALLGGLLAASPALLGVQVWAMSESLFLFLGFAGLLVLLEYFECPRALTLIGASILCGLAFLTRYIGVAFVATGGLALLLLGKGADRRVRLSLKWPAMREALLFGIVAVVPMLIWLVVDFAATGTVGSRSGQPAAAYWQRFLAIGPALENIYLFWFLPDSIVARLPGLLRPLMWLGPLVMLAALVVILIRRDRAVVRAGDVSPASAAGVRLAVLFGLFILVFLVVLAVVQVFTYPPITLASRMLSPVHLAVLVLVLSMLHLVLALLVPRARMAALLVIAVVYLGCLGLFGTYALRSAQISRAYRHTGIGYMSPDWQELKMLPLLRELDPNIPIISNETTAIMFFLNRPAYPIKEIYQDQPQAAFTMYGSGDDPGQAAFREQGGALVLFNITLRDDFAMYGDKVDARIKALTNGLVPVYQSEEGGIYFYARPTSQAPEDENCD